MKKNISLVTLLISTTKDVDMRNASKDELAERFGVEESEMVLFIFKSPMQGREWESFGMSGLRRFYTLKDSGEILDDIKTARDQENFSDSNIMELYHSNDDFFISKAKEFMVLKHTRYIHSVISRYYPSYTSISDELFQSGTLGLLEAMKSYTPSKGAFTTYSKFYIQHEISQQINFHKSSTTHFNNLQRKIQEAIMKIQEEGYEPTAEKIYILTGIKPEMIKREMEVIERSKLVYLDADDSEEQANVYADSPETIVERKERDSYLKCSVDDLEPETRRVILLKMNCYTNEQIARELGITIGRVKTCFQNGIRTLKKDYRLCVYYREYLSDAEKELLNYSIPICSPLKSAKEQIEDIMEIIGDMDGTDTDDTPLFGF